MKIIEYKIIEEASMNDMVNFTRRINEHIKDNWQPYGPVVERNNKLNQPMVKYAKE